MSVGRNHTKEPTMHPDMIFDAARQHRQTRQAEAGRFRSLRLRRRPAVEATPIRRAGPPTVTGAAPPGTHARAA